jgi:hypothetical protein
MGTPLTLRLVAAVAISTLLLHPGRALQADEAVDIVIPAGAEWTIRETLERAGTHPNVTLQWDPAEKKLNAKLVVTRDVVLPAADPLPTLQALLVYNDLVLVPVNTPAGTIHVVVDVVQSQRVLRLRAENVDPTDLDALDGAPGRFVQVVISTPHLADLRETRTALFRVLTPNIGHIQEIQEARAFVVVDFAPNVANAIRTIRAMDDAARLGSVPPVLRAVRLEHTSARDVAALLTEQFAEGPVRVIGNQQVAVQIPNRPRVQPMLATNTLLVSGTQESVDRILEVVASLDVAPEVPASLHVLPVADLDPSVTAATLQTLIDAAPDAWRAGGVRAPVVVAHPEAGALVVHATEPAMQLVRAAVKTLEDGVRQEGEGTSDTGSNRR